MKPPSPNPSSFLLRMLQQTGTPDSLQGASTLGNSSKMSSCSISRGSNRSSKWKKIFCPALNEKKKHSPISLIAVLHSILSCTQAPQVSDDQVIAQASHSHLVRQRPKIVSELYEQFTKFSKSEIQHFHKHEQQRKVSKANEAPRPRYNEK
jgi:hypothetical protein